MGAMTVDEKTQLIYELDQSREGLRAALAGLGPKARIYSNWTVKELLAHICGWDEATVASLRAHAAGIEPAVPASRGIDPYNAESVETRKALSFEQTVKEWELTREELKTVIREMPPEKFEQPLIMPWGPTGSVASLVRIFVEHEVEHAEEVRRLRLPM
jgi:uncharacterized protein (TIGR03083 family)